MDRKCPICGKRFKTSNGNAKYCSDACRIIGYKNRQKRFNERHFKKDVKTEKNIEK